MPTFNKGTLAGWRQFSDDTSRVLRGLDGWRTIIAPAVSGPAGVCLVGGELVMKQSTQPTDRVLVMVSGGLVAKVSPQASDFIVTLSGGSLTAS